MTFRDREHAGKLLAEKLERYRAERPVVLGLTRGGLPVALEVARALGAVLDALVVRKIGAPGSPEYAVGAVAEGGATYVRREALAEVGLGEEDVARMALREAEEIARRVSAYRGERPLPELAGRTVVPGLSTKKFGSFMAVANACCTPACGRTAVISAPDGEPSWARTGAAPSSRLSSSTRLALRQGPGRRFILVRLHSSTEAGGPGTGLVRKRFQLSYVVLQPAPLGVSDFGAARQQ